MSNVYPQLWYSTRDFHPLQMIILVAYGAGVVDLLLASIYVDLLLRSCF